ncbi:MAG: efflux RND transporter permease subunit [Bryobacterales bacterium]|nr:efflux RND transporter permease subunit [Bryobacterales bacterium]
MTDRLLHFIFRQRLAVVLLALALAGVGIWAFTQLSIEAYPDISDAQVIVITLYPGQAPEEVEQQVTIPIERALNNVPDVIARRSRTIFGLSVVDLTFAWGTDEYRARQIVLERLRDADLPEGVSAALAPPITPAGELYRYTLEGEGGADDEAYLREIQDWVIAPRLLQVPGVGDVFAFGGLIKQYQIQVEPLALYKYGLSIDRVAEAVGANNSNAGGSLLSSGEQGLVVRGVGLIQTVSDIGNIVVASQGGTPVFIRDVARIEIGAAPRTGIFGLDGRSGRVEGVVVMRRGENPSAVLGSLREALGELNAEGLPRGVRIEPIYDRTELVNNTLRTVARTLAEALLIIFLVLLFFLGSLKAALLTALIVPLSLLFAFAGMQVFGVTASLLSLGALDFGIIIDGTLVMVASIVQQLSIHRGRDYLADVRHAAARVQRPIFFSLIILICAYFPLFMLERVERRLFAPMAFTVCAALVGSLLLTLTLVPVLATVFFPRGAKPWKNPLLSWLARRYEKTLRHVTARPWEVAGGSLLIVAMAGGLGTRLGTEFLPQLDEGVIWIRAVLPPGISLEKSAQVANEIRSVIRTAPEVARVTSQTGRQDSNTEPFGPNRNEILVALKPYATWADGKSKADLVQELSVKLRAQIPGATFTFTQPIMDMVTEAITGSSADLAVILSGPDLGVLRRKAAEALEVVRHIPGSADAAIEQEADQPQLRIRIDRQEAARHGINVADVQEVIELAIGGRPVSTMFEGDRRFDISVRYVPEARGSLRDIGSVLVGTAEGSRVPLSRLADIQVADGASIIARREGRRQVSVRTNIRGRDEGGFVSEAQRALREKLTLPPGYRIEWGGQFENLERARKRLAWILPLTVLVIFALLYWTFASARQAVLVLASLPFSIVGGITALYLRGIPFSVSAAVGFVSLFGVAVMSGILYVSEINRRRKERGVGLEEAILAGALEELRPCLILITVALLGMVPAALARGIGSDIQRPLATVVVGGLASTLVFTLVAIPGLYCLTERRKARQIQ